MKPFTIILFLLMFPAMGCHPRLPPQKGEMKSEVLYIHQVVTKKENLRTIAAWYTGNPNHWRSLLTYNGHIRPFDLKQSLQIRIPEELMVRFDPIDEDFVNKNQISYSSLRKKTPEKKGAEPTQASTPSDPAPLFDEEPEPADDPALESQQEKLIENLLPEQ